MRPRVLWRLIRIAGTFVVLLAAWLLFSATLAPLSVAAGTFCSIMIAMLAYDVFIEEHEAARTSVLPRLLPVLTFPFALTAAMYVSAFSVFRSVVTGNISPRVVHFRSRLRSDLARVVLAESITFTPGTIVIELDEDHFIVHWLNATTRHSTLAGEEVKGHLESRIRRIWG